MLKFIEFNWLIKFNEFKILDIPFDNKIIKPFKSKPEQ